MTSSVVFTPEAEEQLVDLYRYITTVGSPEAAARYTDSIVTFCEELATFPHQGRARDDIRPGLRIIGFWHLSEEGQSEHEVVGRFRGARRAGPDTGAELTGPGLIVGRDGRLHRIDHGPGRRGVTGVGHHGCGADERRRDGRQNNGRGFHPPSLPPLARTA